jgi:hypothetical protein
LRAAHPGGPSIDTMNYPPDIYQLRALSIRQPWAWCILHAGKRVENRTWALHNPGRKFRGRFLIHASSGMTRAEYAVARGFAREAFHKCNDAELVMPDAGTLPRGCIVGVAEVIDCIRFSDHPWFTGRVHWPQDCGLLLANVQPLAPIDCKGQLGFFKPNLPEGLL